VTDTERIRVAYLADTLLGGGGMGRYAREVLAALARRDDVDLVPFVPRDAMTLARELGGGRVIEVEAIRGPTRIGQGLWERLRLGRVAQAHECHLVHGVKHIVPTPVIPTVLTVHDLMPLTSNEQFGLVKRLLLPSQYRASIEDATTLIAVSHATAARLATEVPGSDSKTVVVPNGVGDGLLQVAATPISSLQGVDFALVVGDLSPRKNVGMLLDIWPEVHASTSAQLVVVGPDGWRSSDTRARLDDATARGIAIRLRDLTDAELRWCYERARVVLCPSVEEGFGLPVAEALALGAPVIASTDAALVEVARGHARHVAPTDRAAWRAAVEDAVRAEAPRVPVAPPTWQEHADGVVAAYHRAIATTP
jgi:glycosyltransferase involved in cell wall biosynthesis